MGCHGGNEGVEPGGLSEGRTNLMSENVSNQMKDYKGMEGERERGQW